MDLTADQQAVLSRPEASLLVKAGQRCERVHWISNGDLPLYAARLKQRLAQNSLRCLPSARLIEEEAGALLMVDAGAAEFQPWASPLEQPHQECVRLLGLLAPLVDALEELHRAGLVWLNFDPGKLEPGRDGSLRFTNLDLEVYAAGQLPEQLTVLSEFAAPEIIRSQPEKIGPRTDVFHLSIFTYYWLASLLPKGIPGEGLAAFGYQLPKLRVYAPWLPLGIAGILERGMALEPAGRFATPSALLSALKATVEADSRRLDFQGEVGWDVGAETRTGRTKAALGKVNEDRVLLRSFDRPPRLLAAVADGITTCDVGSGALASLITTIILENTFDEAATAASFPQLIARACRQGADTLLDWAVEKGYAAQLKQGADLMGTTLTAAWLQGNILSLANLGDSRAYLIDEHGVEQLTVDGDLASGMLADGVAPETTQQLGTVAKALRECIGGCSITAEGALVILDDCCTPAVYHWPLLAGDTIVLCSDGLVEEGAFIEPEELRELIRMGTHLSSQEMARHLVDTADNLHRLPSLLEPDGFGDNISCIVIKITSKDA